MTHWLPRLNVANATMDKWRELHFNRFVQIAVGQTQTRIVLQDFPASGVSGSDRLAANWAVPRRWHVGCPAFSG